MLNRSAAKLVVRMKVRSRVGSRALSSHESVMKPSAPNAFKKNESCIAPGRNVCGVSVGWGQCGPWLGSLTAAWGCGWVELA